MITTYEDVKQIEKYMQEHGLPRGDFSTRDMLAIEKEIKALEAGSVIVEVGVRFGCSLTAMAIMAKDGIELHGIDIEDPDGRKEYWERSGLDKVATFHQGDSVDIAKGWTKKVDFLHIDGDHRYDYVLGDARAWFPHMKKGGVIAFHDFDGSSTDVMCAAMRFVHGYSSLITQVFVTAKVFGMTSILLVYL